MPLDVPFLNFLEKYFEVGQEIFVFHIYSDFLKSVSKIEFHDRMML